MSDETTTGGSHYYGADALITDNRIGPNFGKPIILRECSAENARLRERVAELETALDGQNTAVRELHEAALEKERDRALYWMTQRDKFCDQLADEEKAHARTQEWLYRLRSESAIWQVRAVMAEQELAKVRATLDAVRRLAEEGEEAACEGDVKFMSRLPGYIIDALSVRAP